MLKCHQCEKPAMCSIGEQKIPLCLDCNLKLEQAKDIQDRRSERLINFLSDSVDDTLGFPRSGPRFPERKSVTIEGVSLNNINVNNSTIGVINTGNIKTVDVSLSTLKQSGDVELAQAITELTNAILISKELNNDAKNESIEILSVVSSEVTVPKEKRKNSVIKTLLNQLNTVVSVSTRLTLLWEKWSPIIQTASESIS